jgi:predicted RNA-binding protein with PUA-like domain
MCAPSERADTQVRPYRAENGIDILSIGDVGLTQHSRTKRR